MPENTVTRRSQRAAAPKKTKTNQKPEWLDDTPSTKYTLEAAPSEGGIEQSIEMTVEEYDALKGHLAKLRGYVAPQGRP